jgi:hypothetical protein
MESVFLNRVTKIILLHSSLKLISEVLKNPSIKVDYQTEQIAILTKTEIN